MAVGLKPPEGLLPVSGVTVSACSAGIYRNDRLDLALLAFDPHSSCAAVFTQNLFCAAPVQVARLHLQAGSPGYCLINAGNANAGTGARGYQDALRICEELAVIMSTSKASILPFSTGVIGEYLPLEKIINALPILHAGLAEDNWLDCARAIMTTDTIPKAVSKRIHLGGAPVTITGIAKGSGMIRPDMATLLAFIATDAAVEQTIVEQILKDAVMKSFNRISVDGDTSTNDACLLIATGKAQADVIDNSTSDSCQQLKYAIEQVCIELAQSIIRDGEGATKFIEVSVAGGESSAECLHVAYTIAHSPLVKTAFYASDPNWGRILAAIGRTGLHDFDLAKVSIYLNEVCIVEQGMRSESYSEDAGQRVMAQENIVLQVNLGRGKATETVWTCDLSYEYVKINAEYRT